MLNHIMNENLALWEMIRVFVSAWRYSWFTNNLNPLLIQITPFNTNVQPATCVILWYQEGSRATYMLCLSHCNSSHRKPGSLYSNLCLHAVDKLRYTTSQTVLNSLQEINRKFVTVLMLTLMLSSVMLDTLQKNFKKLDVMTWGGTILYLAYFLITKCILWLLLCVSSSSVQNQNKAFQVLHAKWILTSHCFITQGESGGKRSSYLKKKKSCIVPMKQKNVLNFWGFS